VSKIVLGGYVGLFVLLGLAGCDGGSSPGREPCSLCGGTGRTRSGPCLVCEGRGYRVISRDEAARRERAEENQRRISRGEPPVEPPVSNGARAASWLERNFGETVAVFVVIGLVVAWASREEIAKALKGGKAPPGPPSPPAAGE